MKKTKKQKVPVAVKLPGKPPGKMYFTGGTEAAIIAYNKSNDMDEREQIYRSSIQAPLDKLAENIINRFKFPYIDGSFEEVKAQVVSFLVLNLHKFTEDKGKAFSYFSVIAKNYLILHNNLSYKSEKRMVYFSDKLDDSSIQEELIIDDSVEASENSSDTREFIRIMIEYWDNNLYRIFKKKRDIEIANAIIQLFRRAENIENFNKKAIYLLVREMTNYRTNYITKVVNKMRTHVLRHMKEYRRRGLVEDGSKYFSYTKTS